MKKYLSMLLAVSVLCSGVLCTPLSAAASDAKSEYSQTIFFENFEGYTLNYGIQLANDADFYTKFEYGAAGNIRKLQADPETGGTRGKVIEFSTPSGKSVNKLYVHKTKHIAVSNPEYDTWKKIKIEMDFYPTAASNKTFNIFCNSDNNSIVSLAYMNDDGTIGLTNSSAEAEYIIGRWNTISFEIDLAASPQSYKVYLNGGETPIAANTLSGINGIHRFGFIDRNANTATTYFDNLSYKISDNVPEEPEKVIYELGDINVKRSSTGYSFSGNTENTGKMYIARYKNNSLTEVSTVNAAAAESGYTYSSGEITCPEGETLRCFLWDDILTPYTYSTDVLRAPATLFSELRDKWRSYYAPSVTEEEKTEYHKALDNIHTTALRNANNMKMGDNINRLWGLEAYTATSTMTYEYELVYNMALAWASEGQALYHDEALREKIVYAVEWLNAHYYGEKETLNNGTGGWRSMHEHDWWDWFVGTPQHLMHTILLMEDTFTKEQIEKYLIPFDYAVENMRIDLTVESNVNSRAYVIMLASVLRGNQEEIDNLTDAYKVLFQFTDSGTGMYKDYSYIKHNMIPYNGFYGTGALLDRVIKIMAITGSTPFKLNDEYLNIYVDWIKYAFEPLMVNAGTMNMVRGRGIENGKGENDALTVFASMLDMLESLNAEDRAYFENMIVRHLKGERLENAKINLTVNQLKILNEVLAKNITPNEYIYTHIYNNMDRAVQHTKDYVAGLAMSSERIANYESLDHVNEKGWYTADGMLYVYNDEDINQFDPDYFQNVDPYKMPGTTVDTQLRDEVSVVYGQEYFSGQDFVGGANLDNTAALAMQLESFHNETYIPVEDTGGGEGQPLHDCSLMAKKSWFMFDDEIVCLGSDIDANDGFNVRTIIENRKMQTGNEEFTTETNYAYIEGTGGYYFPEANEIQKNVNESGNFKFYEMWLDHGVNPIDAAYSYVILPMMSKAETTAYVQNPDIEILNNTNSLQAVKDKSTNTSGFIFWQSGEFNGIKTNKPLIIMKKITDNGCILTFADPTHKLASVVITLDGTYSCDNIADNITVTAESGKTVITADLQNAGGETFALSLRN